MLIQINNICSINPKCIKTLQIITKGKDGEIVYSIQMTLHDNSKHIIFSTTLVQTAQLELQNIFSKLHSNI